LTNKPLTRDAILHRLAEVLDDGVLRQLFPDRTPAQIRRIMRNLPQDESDTPATDAPVSATASVDAQVPLTRRCRLFTDGASRGNPGQAGAGAVLLTDQGDELATCSAYLGSCTNNVAEYKALIMGLDKALLKGCANLAIFLDSELIVRQIQGSYKVKNEALLPLFRMVRERLARMQHWSISHVPRAQNARADQLANQGIDQRNA
jgi:ribonuclease HI/probable phosphoglycerate mutase